MALGWAQFFGGLGKFFGKIPIQERKERWKNEIDNLTKEREALIRGKYDEKKGDRVIVIDQRLQYLNQLLKNSANDN
jgi:hypothetical protein